jgi:uncharacterized protein YgfB (UPF0149 family)
MSQDITYVEVQSAIVQSSVSASAEEAHGFLSGMLCMDLNIDSQQWLSHFFGAESNLLGDESQNSLKRLFLQTRRQLVDFDFTFDPLLPGDDISLDRRALALGGWCHGFLQGIGYSGKDSGWPGECSEILRDFLEIVRLDPGASGEGDETDYFELTEYVRVGVQVIQSEFQATTSQQLH